MSTRELISSTLKASKKRLVIPINSDITSSTIDAIADAFRDAVKEHPQENWKTIYFDLRNARMIDSKGINWLFSEVRRLQMRGRIVVFQVASPAVHRVMQFSGLDDLVIMKFRRRRQTR